MWVLVVYSFLYRLFFGFGFSIKYRVSIKFWLAFFKYLLYNRIQVLLIFLYSKLRLLLGLGWCSTCRQFIGFSRNSRFLIEDSSRMWC